MPLPPVLHRAEPCQLPSERVVYLGPQGSLASPAVLGVSSWAGHCYTYRKGRGLPDQLCPPHPQLEKGSHVVQADLESVYFVLLVIKPRNPTCSASILPTELHPSPCCVVKGELEFCHRLPPMSETAPHSRPPAIELLSQVLTSEHTDVCIHRVRLSSFPRVPTP